MITFKQVKLMTRIKVLNAIKEDRATRKSKYLLYGGYQQSTNMLFSLA
jgi:hypothetical protein